MKRKPAAAARVPSSWGRGGAAPPATPPPPAGPQGAVRLGTLRTRGEVKALAEDMDRDPALDAELRALALARGIANDLPAKTLVRALLDRSGAAQVRTTPIHRDEAFECLHCGAAVAKGGSPVRDHCPLCLRGRHVDVVPGDRAADCGGVLDPIGLERRPGGIVIRYACRSCAHTFLVTAHPDDVLTPLYEGMR